MCEEDGDRQWWSPGWKSEPGQWDKLKSRAREARKNPTRAEKLLWEELRGKQLRGFKFRRQHVIAKYIVDFYCHEAGLVVEVDGPVHLQRKEYDDIRERRLKGRGLKVLRFTNSEVESNLPRVLREIEAHLRDD